MHRIAEKGPMPFRDFMEMVLYHPEGGYYASSSGQIGKNGDYYTSPYLTQLFGEMIARQLEEMWHLLGRGKFTILEYGAGPGLLCHDILQYCKNNSSFYEALEYCIIEKSSAMREKERQILPGKVRWVDAVSELEPITGCILSNELIDNFAVHVVEMQQELMELYIGYQDDFIENWRPASESLRRYLDTLRVQLPVGYRTEINLQVIDWIKEISGALHQGFVLTIDYGGTSADLYNPRRCRGSMQCFHKHAINSDIFSNIGEQDITAHVNFSALHFWGLQNGLSYGGYTTQLNFLLSLGLSAHLKKQEEEGQHRSDHEKKMLLINTFLLDMGKKLKVLVLQKGVQERLSGMRLAPHSFDNNVY